MEKSKTLISVEEKLSKFNKYSNEVMTFINSILLGLIFIATLFSLTASSIYFFNLNLYYLALFGINLIKTLILFFIISFFLSIFILLLRKAIKNKIEFEKRREIIIEEIKGEVIKEIGRRKER